MLNLKPRIFCSNHNLFEDLKPPFSNTTTNRADFLNVLDVRIEESGSDKYEQIYS